MPGHVAPAPTSLPLLDEGFFGFGFGFGDRVSMCNNLV